MIQLIEAHCAEIAKLCRHYHVERLEVFGSAATATFRPEASDLDFLVEFKSVAAMNKADQYFGLLTDLERLLRRNIDLVTARSLRNPYFIASVNKTRIPLYAA